MRIGFRIGPLWISERVPPLPPHWFLGLVVLLVLAWLVTK